MITAVSSPKDIPHFCGALAVKQRAVAESYLESGIAKAWVQSNFAAVVKFGNTVTVCDTQKADLEELSEFIKMQGFCELYSSKHLMKTAKITDYTTVFDVKKNTSKDCSFLASPDFSNIKQAYDNLISSGLQIGDFDGFYVDLSHRIRHGTAYLVNREYGSIICFQSGSDAIINGVGVLPEYRNKGKGRELLDFAELEGIKTLYALCSADNLEFYNKCGFTPCGEFAYFNGENNGKVF